MSQRKYVHDLLDETGMLGSKPLDTPTDPNLKLVVDDGDVLEDPDKYRILVGKLNYLSVTRTNIAFPVSVVSQFLSSPWSSHWDAAIRILRYIKGSPGRGLLYCDHGNYRVEGFPDVDWAGHIEVDCHFVREKLQQKLILTNFVRTAEQLAYVCTNSLCSGRIKTICNKLGMYDMYAPARGGVLDKDKLVKGKLVFMSKLYLTLNI
ncbi:hypothetical protein CFOL_v3_00718 [Cephalotus follicularis]|uniref:RVT_2 domain-containing protein n=1 Tax=Cephalotus follicularis TaxID=3775 RepID=A0A1Q3ANH2_CEPFO|nr:hypothetical protein CFOL_v3_00718 [Cephalotus follicularis]